MKRTLLAMSLLAAGIGVAQAEDYQFEVTGSYTDASADAADGSIIGASIGYAFAPISTKDVPLAEAAFLGRANSVSLTYSDAEVDDTSIESESINGFVQFYLGDIYLRGGYGQTDNTGLLGNSATVDTFVARVGYVISDGLQVNIGVNRNDNDASDDATNDLVLEGKYVSLMDAGSALNITGLLRANDDDYDSMFANLAADYYINPAFSVGAQYTSTDGDDAYESTADFGIRSRYFFMPTLSGEVEYFTTGDGDVDNIVGRVAFRF